MFDGILLKKTKGEPAGVKLPVPQMWRIWGKNLVLGPNPYPQKGGEKVL